MTENSKDVRNTLEQLGAEHLPGILGLIEDVVVRGAPDGSSLPEMCSYHMSTGGKRLRALLPLAVAQALGRPARELVPFGAACELLHNATLVHDDLQDGDTVRRDAPTVWVEFGEARAINLGDAMLYYTLMLVDALERPVAARHRASNRVLRETLRVIDGQEREFLLKDMGDPSPQDYIRMVEGKTSGLFSLPIAGAAELCGADDDLLDALAEASRHLGVVFQIQDDLLDLFGDKGRGQAGSDLGEGKISMLVVHALAHAPDARAQWLRDLLEAPREDLTPALVDEAIALFESTGAVDAAFAEIDRRCDAALGSPALEATPKLRDLLAGLADVFLAPVRQVGRR
jgi:geranylgeranyl pyrophosphate synthase